ncbi:MAG: ParA family protein, partial [Desulfobacterales bacterium]|nr:ParA family protein [Desulfobacterales bacterium]
MIISYVQTKGGTGKSTLALNTAFSQTMNQKFSKIALVELDPQGTLRNWWNEREEAQRGSGNVSFHHISSTQKEVLQEGIKTISSHNQLIILDTPGESTSKLHTKVACVFSDMVIVPMRTSTNDEMAFAENLYPIIKEIIKVAPEKKNSFYVLPAFTHPQSKIDKYLEYFDEVLPANVKCLKTLYPARSIYENFNREGLTLIEYAKSIKTNKKYLKQGENAVSDIEDIAKNIINIL